MLLKNGEKADVDEKHTETLFVILTTEIHLFEISTINFGAGNVFVWISFMTEKNHRFWNSIRKQKFCS